MCLHAPLGSRGSSCQQLQPQSKYWYLLSRLSKRHATLLQDQPRTPSTGAAAVPLAGAANQEQQRQQRQKENNNKRARVLDAARHFDRKRAKRSETTQHSVGRQVNSFGTHTQMSLEPRKQGKQGSSVPVWAAGDPGWRSEC